MENLLQYGRGPSTNSVPVDNNTGIETENLLQYGNLGAVPSTLTDAVEPVFDEEYANSWGNRFAIGVDNTQASLFKGLDLIADITESEGLKNYAQEGIIKNQQEAASKPQPTRTASFTEASKEIKQ